jgi:signal transduction histidine kinase
MAVLSIRQKVIASVTALYVCMGGSFLGAYYLMHGLEDKINYLEDISKLEESVLEIRRFEKNYFLYGDRNSLRTALYYLDRVKDLAVKNDPKIQGLSSAKEAREFQQNLEDYRMLITPCSENLDCLSGDKRTDFEVRTRKLGTYLADFAENLIRRKRLSIKESIRSTVQLQLFAFAVVAIGLTVTGTFLSSKVLKPLRRLETATGEIARGHFDSIPNLPPEKELRQIFDSFNRMAAQLKVREDQLVQTKKLASLGTMLAGVAHEVNNPLSNISSSCEILIEDINEMDKEHQKALMRKVLEQVDKARTIVRNLLEFSRNNEFFKENLNLRDLLEKTLSLLKGQIPARVEISIEVNPDLTIVGDRQRIQQAFMNLITNAIQSIDDQGTIKIKARKNTYGSVVIRIKDTGKGIPEQDLPQIFDPFFTTKDVGHGTGLGLFITHDIIIRHGGTIRVESTIGKGTTFTITVPSGENPDE